MTNNSCKVIFKVLCLLLLGGGLFLQAAVKVLIFTIASDLSEITRQITGGMAELNNLCDGREDPHALTVRPSFVVKARTAQVWIRVGLELEVGWEPPILRDSRNLRIQVGAPGHIDVSEKIIPLDVPQGKITRDQGDVHAYGNPHYWLDPLNGRLAARYIAERLEKLYPEHAEEFRVNLSVFLRLLDERMFGATLVERLGGAKLWQLLLQDGLESESADLFGGWYAMLRPYAGHPVATYHRSWIYLLQRFQLHIAGELEPKPGIPPSPRHLYRLSENFKKQGVKVILQEPFYSDKAAELLAAKLPQSKILICPNSSGGESADSYLNMLDNVIKSLARAFAELE